MATLFDAENISPVSLEAEVQNIPNNKFTALDEKVLERVFELSDIIIEHGDSTRLHISELEDKIATLNSSFNHSIASLVASQSQILSDIATLEGHSRSVCICRSNSAVLAEAIHHIINHLEQISVSSSALRDSSVSPANKVATARQNYLPQGVSNDNADWRVMNEAIIEDHPQNTREGRFVASLDSLLQDQQNKEKSLSTTLETQVAPTSVDQSVSSKQLTYARKRISHLMPHGGRLPLHPEDLLRRHSARELGHLFSRDESMQKLQKSSAEQQNYTIDSLSANSFQPPATIPTQMRAMDAENFARRQNRPTAIYELSSEILTPPESASRGSSPTEMNGTADPQDPEGEEQQHANSANGSIYSKADSATSIYESSASRPTDAPSIHSTQDHHRSIGERIRGSFCQMQ